RTRRQLIVESDDETQPPSDDGDGAAGAGYGTTAGGGSVAPSSSYHTGRQGGSGQGEHAGSGSGQGGQPGYGGQQQAAGWPYVDYYGHPYPYETFQPGQLNLPPISTDVTSSYGSNEYGYADSESSSTHLSHHGQPAGPAPTL